jgi:hypothetical protein
MDIETLLRPHRKALVLAAEAAVEDAWAAARAADDRPPDKTQLNRLVSICGEATCAEEITNYLRYQVSRKSRPWPRAFADTVIAKISGPLDAMVSSLRDAAEADRVRVAAWRLYAVFLARAFTYTSYVHSGKKGQDHERARR